MRGDEEIDLVELAELFAAGQGESAAHRLMLYIMEEAIGALGDADLDKLEARPPTELLATASPQIIFSELLGSAIPKARVATDALVKREVNWEVLAGTLFRSAILDLSKLTLTAHNASAECGGPVLHHLIRNDLTNALSYAAWDTLGEPEVPHFEERTHPVHAFKQWMDPALQEIESGLRVDGWNGKKATDTMLVRQAIEYVNQPVLAREAFESEEDVRDGLRHMKRTSWECWKYLCAVDHADEVSSLSLSLGRASGPSREENQSAREWLISHAFPLTVSLFCAPLSALKPARSATS